MAQQSFIKKFKPVLVLGAVGLAFSLLACSTKGGSGSGAKRYSKDLFGNQGYEYGPSVNKLVVELENPVSTVETADVKVKPFPRIKVTDAYLSDENGNKTDKKSQYVTLDLAVSYNPRLSQAWPVRLPITWSFRNQWVKEYPVTISDLTVSGKKLSKEENTIANRIIPEAEAFTVRKEFSGTYLNALKKQEEKLTLNYAAFGQKPSKMVRKIPSSSGSMVREKGEPTLILPFWK